MDEQTKKLGNKIKEIRLSKKVSLRNLAKHIGLTRSFLSQVELGKSAPSIASLQKIARGLNIHLVHFFEEDFPKRFFLIRKRRDKKFVSKNQEVSCEVLVSDMLDINMVPILFTLEAGGEVDKARLVIYRKERFITVQKGKVEFLCDTDPAKSFVLDEGDSIYCKHDISCSKMRNIGGKKAVVLWVVSASLI